MQNFIALVVGAKKAGVSAAVLLAICSVESNLQNTNHHNDGGSTSYGICQVKKNSAVQVGFLGKDKDLEDPETNAFWAAKYLKYQLDRYDGNKCKAVSAYNAGSFHESSLRPGYPKNLRYVRKIQNKLPENLRYQLKCGNI